MMDAPREVWVFHRGALGDSVLLWPRLRHWVRSGARVHLATDRAKADLAVHAAGVIGVDAEQRRFSELWREDAAPEPLEAVDLVVDHVSGAEAGAFRRNLAAMFPRARLLHESPPKGGREGSAWAEAHPLARVEPRGSATGPIVLSVGAGSQAKRWPLERWACLHSRLPHPVRVIAGEVENERFTRDERRRFESVGGEFLPDLPALAACLKAARLVIACDSGPAHLAAQLGVSTLALFGPTDPDAWSPVGPCVRILAPDRPSPMGWLDADRVLGQARSALADQRQRPMKYTPS